MIFGVHPLIALGVLASTAATDAAYVFFNASVSGRRRVWAANWSAIWYLLSAFAVISYTENAIYVLFRRQAPGSVRLPQSLGCGGGTAGLKSYPLVIAAVNGDTPVFPGAFEKLDRRCDPALSLNQNWAHNPG